MKRLRRISAAAVSAIASVALASALVPAPVASAGGEVRGGVAKEGSCPATAIVAARGSEQNDPAETIPTRYSPASPYVSNGYEGPNLRALLQQAQAQHRAETGADLLAEVPVLAVDEEHYPASFPLPRIAEEGETLTLPETLARMAQLFTHTPPHIIVATALTEFHRSLATGIPGALATIDEYEAATGCTPNYVLLGYSQGAFILNVHEAELARRGQLGGVLAIGNAAQPLPGASFFPAGTGNRYSYCLRGDLVCDLAGTDPARAVDSINEVHDTYFTTPRASDEAALREMRRVIVGAGG
ncbi:MAG TPA: cutinase family protein [Candidatus Corynebacterium gallistercoris]|uniref:Cutinase family protein n=1 Tax=Candidatus Corynebacterium gallistercoris TaxID=2838530 RepID=A0A9D1RXM4_9CORY|nr:cutinase family protein [Candidatus Corynebacterium gallistercoris]